MEVAGRHPCRENRDGFLLTLSAFKISGLSGRLGNDWSCRDSGLSRSRSHVREVCTLPSVSVDPERRQLLARAWQRCSASWSHLLSKQPDTGFWRRRTFASLAPCCPGSGWPALQATRELTAPGWWALERGRGTHRGAVVQKRSYFTDSGCCFQACGFVPLHSHQETRHILPEVKTQPGSPASKAQLHRLPATWPWASWGTVSLSLSVKWAQPPLPSFRVAANTGPVS